ncbi:hypothetical protein GCM10007159_39770 [Modicisalibacter luteus]|nr:hypothetical protein GCM10007159_39770 [Halomonas lutea]
MGISVTTERNGTLRQQVQVDSFESFVTDAPLEFGGEASAPDAHDHFDLSLGVCKADDCDHLCTAQGTSPAGRDGTCAT